ncbi:hypothetical protein [Streptomyces flaveolus]|uniref:hypothetical protein n=1 Tax=Streptomyces flaveolus TaxID=67297 RepID=UPI0033D8387B
MDDLESSYYKNSIISSLSNYPYTIFDKRQFFGKSKTGPAAQIFKEMLRSGAILEDKRSLMDRMRFKSPRYRTNSDALKRYSQEANHNTRRTISREELPVETQRQAWERIHRNNLSEAYVLGAQGKSREELPEWAKTGEYSKAYDRGVRESEPATPTPQNTRPQAGPALPETTRLQQMQAVTMAASLGYNTTALGNFIQYGNTQPSIASAASLTPTATTNNHPTNRLPNPAIKSPATTTATQATKRPLSR